MKKTCLFAASLLAVLSLFFSCEDNDGFTVKYTSNGAIAGTGEVPTDDTDYNDLDFVEVKAPTGTLVNKEGHPFDRWKVVDGDEVTYYNPGETAQINNANILFIATYDDARTVATAKYTVKHYQQNLSDDNYPTNPTDKEELSGIIGTETNAQKKTSGEYAGFTAESYSQATVTEDGSAVVEIKYARNTYTVTYNANIDGVAESGWGGTVPGAQTGKYGSSIEVLFSENPLTRTGYTFAGWAETADATEATYTEDNKSLEIPAHNVTLYAVWTPEGAMTGE